MEKKRTAEVESGGRVAVVAFPGVPGVERSVAEYPDRAHFEEDAEAGFWLKKWLAEADIHVDNELFWLCYEHPEALAPGEAVPDLADHLARTVARVLGFRRHIVAGYVYRADVAMVKWPDRFVEQTPVMTSRPYLPRSLRPYAAAGREARSR